MSDHAEQTPATWVAMVCDRGIRHSTNDDAGAVRASTQPGERGVLVVCDGVSSATDSAKAARTASMLVADTMAMPTSDDEQRLSAAIMEANEAVSTLAPGSEHPPSCTIAAAVVTPGSVLVGWMGDSRVYWFPDEGPAELLTTDDSMAQLRIEWGVERTVAEHGPGAHTITRWLGRGAPIEPPHLGQHDLSGPGWLLVCSDGLWNYASAPDELAHVVRQQHNAAPGGTTIDFARALVTWANDQGGADNVTVAVARLEAQSG